jgi:hypothetical protein
MVVGAPADDLLAAVRIERVPAVAVHLEDEVGRRLDQRAVAQLRSPQLAFEALTLADVADRALAADEPAVLEHADAVRSVDAGPVLRRMMNGWNRRALSWAAQASVAVPIDSSATTKAKCWPIISSAV